MTAPTPRPLGELLREALPTYQAPESLHAWARAQAANEAQPHHRAGSRPRLTQLAYAAGLVAALALGWTGQRIVDATRDGSGSQKVLVASLVDTHVRSLMADHLTDVPSSDHHTVKPWFAGKIDFSPPVPDLKARGFELVGGRLDYVQRQPVAAVVYRKHGHIINVLSALPGHGLGDLPHSERVQGYTLRAWRQAGLELVAISDIDPRELVNLEEGYEAPPAQSTD